MAFDKNFQQSTWLREIELLKQRLQLLCSCDHFGKYVCLKEQHCVKSIHIRSFSGPYFSVFGLNTGKYGPEKLRIWTILTQCRLNSLDTFLHLGGDDIMVNKKLSKSLQIIEQLY